MLPPTSHAIPRRCALIAAASITALLTGCSPTPTPTPTPTAAFASEQEAFAAAEKTFEEYTDALNQVDFSEPGTFDSAYSFLSGEAEASTRKAFSEFHASRVITRGATRFDSFDGTAIDPRTGNVTAKVCLDVSDVDVLDASGVSIVSEDRPARQPLAVTFEPRGRDARLMIAKLEPTDEFSCTP